MEVEFYPNNYEKEYNEFVLHVRPKIFYNTETLVKRIVNQGSDLSENQIKKTINDIKKTIKSILIEGGVITIDDFISFCPSISYCKNNLDSKNKLLDQIYLSIKSSIPISFCESIAMEAEIKNKSDKNKKMDI